MDTRVKFGYLSYEDMLQRISDKKLNAYDFVFGKDTREYYTIKGERVRSKSEKIIADELFRKGIPYKYECPLYLKGMGTIYPDFTFLSKKTGDEVYWEHFGMMDSPDYARKAVHKIETYENNGIFPGERLIITYETEKSVLGTEKIARMVDRYLK